MLLWILFAVIIPVFSVNKLCPGGSFSCPDTATCCQLPDGSYGCCPLLNAVCCDDHIHCCPENTKCETGICVQLDSLNITASKLSVKNNISCFGTEYVCPDDTTCCPGSQPETYGCCPMEHAVCCADGQHCCPEGTVCNLKEETCIGQGFISEMYDSQKNKLHLSESKKYSILIKSSNVSSIICPGGSFQCPNGYTCCKLPSGNWGCCPYVNATCCQDHIHCCPENLKCDATSTSCFQGFTSIPSLQKSLSKPVNVDIICPDNTTCSESMTCCRMVSHYGCCPYPNAVCCSDLEHCCPNDMICDNIEKRCVPKLSNMI